MAKSAKRFQKYSKLNIFILAVSLLILSSSVVLWWTKVFKDPKNVFEAMLENNLSNASITRQGVQESEGGLIKQQTQLSFASKTGIHSLTTVRQSSGMGENHVVTETTATPSKDFVRYTKIETQQKSETGQQLDFSPILGVWATQNDQQAQSQFFPEAVLNVFMFGNLPSSQRNELVSKMRDVYEVDYTTARQANQGGRVRYIYDVKVQPAKFVSLFNEYARVMNFSNLSQLDTQNFESSETMNLTVTVDLLSRQLVGVLYQPNQTAETYSGHGLLKPIVEPNNTVTIEEIQKRLSNIQ